MATIYPDSFNFNRTCADFGFDNRTAGERCAEMVTAGIYAISAGGNGEVDSNNDNFRVYFRPRKIRAVDRYFYAANGNGRRDVRFDGAGAGYGNGIDNFGNTADNVGCCRLGREKNL